MFFLPLGLENKNNRALFLAVWRVVWKRRLFHWEWSVWRTQKSPCCGFDTDAVRRARRRDTGFTFAVMRSSVQFHGARERPFAGGGWEKFKSPGLRSSSKRARKSRWFLSFGLARSRDGVNVLSVLRASRVLFAMVVGKRFLCVSGEEPLEPAHIERWSWRAGVIRAVTHRDHDNPELTVRQRTPYRR